MQLETANKPKRHGDANKFEKTKPPPTTTKPTISIITTTKYSEWTTRTVRALYCVYTEIF